MAIVRKTTITHDLPNSDLLLRKYWLLLLQERVGVMREWLWTGCLVAATVEIQGFEVGSTCCAFGPRLLKPVNTVGRKIEVWREGGKEIVVFPFAYFAEVVWFCSVSHPKVISKSFLSRARAACYHPLSLCLE